MPWTTTSLHSIVIAFSRVVLDKTRRVIMRSDRRPPSRLARNCGCEYNQSTLDELIVWGVPEMPMSPSYRRAWASEVPSQLMPKRNSAPVVAGYSAFRLPRADAATGMEACLAWSANVALTTRYCTCVQPCTIHGIQQKTRRF